MVCRDNYRIAGHIIILVSLALPLLWNLIKIELARYSNPRPEIELFAKLRFRYLTIWNAIFTMIYALFGFVCDGKFFSSHANYILTKYMTYRYTFFSGIIFPVSTCVLLFWPIFYYDRELIYKRAYDDVIDVEINYIVHGLVFFYVVWELAFIPRYLTLPRNDWSLYLLHVLNAFYMLVVLYTRYIEPGVWTYEILNQTTGSPIFLVWLFSIWAICLLGYHLQWPLRRSIWRFQDMIDNAVKKTGGRNSVGEYCLREFRHFYSA